MFLWCGGVEVAGPRDLRESVSPRLNFSSSSSSSSSSMHHNNYGLDEAIMSLHQALQCFESGIPAKTAPADSRDRDLLR